MSTDDEINRAIATHLGWEFRLTEPRSGFCGDDVQYWRWFQPKGMPQVELRTCPDYCNDLNACHEMEKILNRSAEERDIYGTELREICANDYSESKYGREVWKATARQRAAAFLKTVAPK